MLVKELILELKKVNQELPVIVPTDINDYKFYDVEGVSIIKLEHGESKNEVEVACISRYTIMY